MPTVRELTHEFLRAKGMTNFPDDFRYVLGLHEGRFSRWPAGTRFAGAIKEPMSSEEPSL